MFAPLEARWVQMPPNLRGILWLLMGTLAFAANDILVNDPTGPSVTKVLFTPRHLSARIKLI